MKVFVYKKLDSSKVAIHEYVSMVQVYDHTIEIYTATGELHHYDTKTVKTSIYQN